MPRGRQSEPNTSLGNQLNPVLGTMVVLFVVGRAALAVSPIAALGRRKTLE